MRKYLPTILGVMLAGILGFVGINQVAQSQKQPLIQITPRNQTPKPLTLLEVWEIAQGKAHSWHADSGIANINSVDHPTDNKTDSALGVDGRRRAWQAILTSRSASEELWITVWDGEVVDVTSLPTESSLVALTKPSVDSAGLVANMLKERPDFIRSDGNSHGYHFAYSITEQGQATLKIAGRHNANNAFLEVDASTGRLIAAQERAYDQLGGVLVSSDSGVTWKPSTLIGKLVKSVYADPLVLDSALAPSVEGSTITIYATKDGGHNWAPVSNLPSVAGDWPMFVASVYPAGQQVIIVGTKTGVWLSKDATNWERVTGLPTGQGQWFAQVTDKSTFRVLVSVTSGEKVGLYASNDLVNWQLQKAGYFRLSEAYDRSSVLATDASDETAKATQYSLNDTKDIALPSASIDMAGDFSSMERVVMRKSSGVASGRRQAVTDSAGFDIAHLSASPEFNQTNTLVAGGFRHGLYRSTDAGASWTETLANATEVVPGSGEIWGIAYLSSQNVVAINGGILIWKSF